LVAQRHGVIPATTVFAGIGWVNWGFAEPEKAATVRTARHSRGPAREGAGRIL